MKKDKKQEAENNKNKTRKSGWFFRDAYYRKREKEERIKSDIDYRHFIRNKRS